jgi:two-component system response regulator FixJ
VPARLQGGAAEFLEKPVDDEPCSKLCRPPCASMCARASAIRPGAGARALRPAVGPREREVLGLIVAGLTNKEIGRALDLSPAHGGNAPRQPLRQARSRPRWRS